MTNFEKYKDEILAGINNSDLLVPRKDGSLMLCDGFSCQQCVIYSMTDIEGVKRHLCTCRLVKWLYEEYKEPAPKLTLEEHSFCVVAHSGYIARDKNGILSIFCISPERKASVWESLDHVFKCIDPKYFPFITWEREPWSISDLLKLEVEK